MGTLVTLFVILISLTIFMVFVISGMLFYKEYMEKSYFRWRNPRTEPLPAQSKKVLCETMSGNLVGGYISTNEFGTAIIVTDPDFHFEDFDGYKVKRWRYLR